MDIVGYDKKYKRTFIDLNMAWLKKYFTPEEGDIAMLYGIDEIIKSGGMAFFALQGETAVSTCLIMPYKNGSREICKLQRTSAFKAWG